jgi:hypothetical protein
MLQQGAVRIKNTKLRRNYFFLGAAFLTTFFTAGFLAATAFFTAGFFAAGFLAATAFLTAGFFAAGFFAAGVAFFTAVAMTQLFIGSGQSYLINMQMQIV